MEEAEYFTRKTVELQSHTVLQAAARLTKAVSSLLAAEYPPQFSVFVKYSDQRLISHVDIINKQSSFGAYMHFNSFYKHETWHY